MIKEIDGRPVLALDGNVLISEIQYADGVAGIGFSELEQASEKYPEPSDAFKGQDAKTLNFSLIIATDNIQSLIALRNIIDVTINNKRQADKKARKLARGKK